MKERYLVKFRSYLNVVWGTEVNGQEAFAFMRGFPATFIMTQRRAIVVSVFMEKQGWFKKKKVHMLCFEAGLHKVKEFKFSPNKKRKTLSAFISFHPHNQLAEGSVIQFLRMDFKVWRAIEDHLTELTLKKPLEDTGIVHVNDTDPKAWLEERLSG